MAFVFVAVGKDGSEYRESETLCWDQVPQDLAKVSLLENEKLVCELELAPGRKVFFANEAVALKPGGTAGGAPQGMLTAKIVGVVENGEVWECRFEVLPEKRIVTRRYPEVEFDMPAALRG